MALEADYGMSTVLEALRVASTLRFPYLWCLAVLARGPARQRHADRGLRMGGEKREGEGGWATF